MSAKNNDAKEVKFRMQNVVDDWETITKTTGGALSLPKCWCWILHFVWKADLWYYTYTNTTKEDLHMMMKDSENKVQDLNYYPQTC